MNNSIQCEGYCKGCQADCHFRSDDYDAKVLDKALEELLKEKG